MMSDMDSIRQDFPLLNRKINGKRIIYLDSTATALKPRAVTDAVNRYDTQYSANVFRGIYKISEQATLAYETARSDIAEFIHAADPTEIIFTRNASESLNLVAAAWAKSNISKNEEIVTTIMEHHSNFVPWQQLAMEKQIKLKIWDVDKNYSLDYRKLDQLITRKTKLLAITSMSNVLGTIVDIEKVVKIVKKFNPKCLVLVDAAQSVPHQTVDVQKWGADFVAFSGHKMLGPTGIGVLWAKKAILEAMPPYQYGGDMIREVHRDRTVWNDVPHKFEAGTPHISGVIGLGAAVNYLKKIGMSDVRKHEIQITGYAIKQLSLIKGLRIYGPADAKVKGGVIAFTVNGIHPHDIAQILDEDNVCIRVGFHCAQPLHEFLGCGPTARASFYIYTTREDIDALAEGLEKVIKILK